MKKTEDKIVHKALNNISLILVMLPLFVIAHLVHGTTIMAQGEDVVVTATGQGYASENLKGTRQGNELAKRAALADAYRNMAKKLYGSEVFEKGDMLVESVNGLVRGAKVTKEECKDGGCMVEIALTYKDVLTKYSEVLSDSKQLANFKNEMERLKSENKALKKQVTNLNKKLKDSKKSP